MTFAKKVTGRLQMMFCKGLLLLADDTDEVQLVKLTANDGEVQDGIERMQDYGFSSNPPANSPSIIAYIGGNKDHGVILKTDGGTSRYTGLQIGEAVFYSMFNNYILHKAGGITDVVGTMINLGADAGVVPLAKITSAFNTAWTTYFGLAATAWTSLGTEAAITGSKDACDAAAAAATTLASAIAPTTKVKGI